MSRGFPCRCGGVEAVHRGDRHRTTGEAATGQRGRVSSTGDPVRGLASRRCAANARDDDEAKVTAAAGWARSRVRLGFEPDLGHLY
jgi:hypothetical protein